MVNKIKKLTNNILDLVRIIFRSIISFTTKPTINKDNITEIGLIIPSLMNRLMLINAATKKIINAFIYYYFLQPLIHTPI